MLNDHGGLPGRGGAFDESKRLCRNQSGEETLNESSEV